MALLFVHSDGLLTNYYRVPWTADAEGGEGHVCRAGHEVTDDTVPLDVTVVMNHSRSVRLVRHDVQVEVELQLLRHVLEQVHAQPVAAVRPELIPATNTSSVESCILDWSYIHVQFVLNIR